MGRKWLIGGAGVAMTPGLAVGVVASGSIAVAASGKSVVAGNPAATPATGKAPLAPQVTTHGPPGYAIVNTGPLTAANGTQTHGTATCPAGTVPLGGGGFTGSSSLATAINSSRPNGNGWSVDFNNSSGVDTTFQVYAECAIQPLRYRIVSSAIVDNPPSSQNGATAICPKGTVAYGGGGFSNSGQTSVNINSSWPTTSGNRVSWSVDMDNASGSDQSVTAYAVCGRKLAKYTVVTGTTAVNAAGGQTFVPADCPFPSAVLGGGVYSNTSDVLVDVNSMAPNGNAAWSSFENNAGVNNWSATAYAVCAAQRRGQG